MRISDWSSDVCSSDLSMIRACAQLNTQGMARRSSMRVDFVREAGRLPIFRPEISRMGVACRKNSGKWGVSYKSEEHTSELQSPMRTSYAVFCLIKKQRYDIMTPLITII